MIKRSSPETFTDVNRKSQGVDAGNEILGQRHSFVTSSKEGKNQGEHKRKLFLVNSRDGVAKLRARSFTNFWCLLPWTDRLLLKGLMLY